MSQDVKYFTACDHYVEGKSYREDMCPRCYGKGWYFDIAFDPSGQAVMANNEIKLQQECLKVLLDDKTSDLFFPQWGSEISAFIGKKKTQALMSRLEMTVRNCIERLKQVQIHEAESNPHINEYEVLNQIEYVELEALSVTEWRVKIVVSNLAGDVIASEINL